MDLNTLQRGRNKGTTMEEKKGRLSPNANEKACPEESRNPDEKEKDPRIRREGGVGFLHDAGGVQEEK